MAAATDVAGLLAARLTEDGIEFAFGGALALAAWGVPRATIDVDVSVFVPPTDWRRVVDALERCGALVAADEAERTATSIGLIVAYVAGTRVDLFLQHHPMHADMRRRRVSRHGVGDGESYFLSASDVVLTKLLYNRAKDRTDLERLFAVCGGQIDVEYVAGWLERIVGADDERLAVLTDLRARFPGD